MKIYWQRTTDEKKQRKKLTLEEFKILGGKRSLPGWRPK